MKGWFVCKDATGEEVAINVSQIEHGRANKSGQTLLHFQGGQSVLLAIDFAEFLQQVEVATRG